MGKVMKKTALVLILLAGTGGVFLQDTAVQAQKKDAKKDTAAGTVIIAEGKDGKYRFQVRSADDKYLAGSAAYKTEKEAHAAVEELKKVLAGAKITVEKPDPKGK